MFYHGYNSYIKYAFPADEIKPLSCGPMSRHQNHPPYLIYKYLRDYINSYVNDVLGNYMLTLIDAMDMLAV